MSETIDLSRLPPPDAIEATDPEAILRSYQDRFDEYWEALRLENPTLPAYETIRHDADAVNIAFQSLSFGRFLDRRRVNDAVLAVLASHATGADLDNIVLRQGIQRRVIVPANPVTRAPAVMESDASVLAQYLRSFERPSAGSVARYLYEVHLAFPEVGHADVVGRAVHRRLGETDIVVAGPGGRDPTDAEMAAVRARVLAPHVVPEATAARVLRAKRAEYGVDLEIDVARGPDPLLVAQDAARRVRAATDARTVVKGEVPSDLLTGSAYGPNVLHVRHRGDFVSIVADPYTVPVCTSLEITPRVRA